MLAWGIICPHPRPLSHGVGEGFLFPLTRVFSCTAWTRGVFFVLTCVASPIGQGVFCLRWGLFPLSLGVRG